MLPSPSENRPPQHVAGRDDPPRAGGSYRRLTPAAIPAFVRDELLSAARLRPIVGLTTHVRPTRLLVDAARLAGVLGERADVVVLETGETTWALSTELPPRLDAYGGAARIWWPGLSAQSDPHHHPLLFVFGPADARAVEARVVAAICGQDAQAGRYGAWRPPDTSPPRAEPAAPAGPPPAAPAPADRAVEATLQAVSDAAVLVTVEGATCRVDPADVPLDGVPEDVRPGQHLRVRPTGRQLDGLPVVEVRDVWQDPWRRLAELFRAGDVVRGRVCRVDARLLLVEVLPGAALLVPIAELDWTFVSSPADLFAVGDRVKAVLLDLAPAQRRGTLSIKQAYSSREPRAVSLGLGHAPFLAEGAGGEPGPAAPGGEAQALTRELEAAVEDRTALCLVNAQLKEQAAALRRELRSAEDRLRDLGSRVSGQLDPTESELAFLAAVRVSYARRFDESERQRYRLARMRVGPDFLERLRALEGVALEKVVDVCAEVAALRAHEIPAREVHLLRSGSAGAPSRERARDGARAWRCSLQDGTASARRLHWWDVPGKDGRVIEFASVGVHDDFTIPE